MLVEANAAERPFRLGLLDMDMPEMDGIAMAKAANGIESLTALPLLLLTSSSRRETGESIRAAGFAASLTKPVRQSHLYDAIVTRLATRTPDPTPEAPDVGPFRRSTTGASPREWCSAVTTTCEMDRSRPIPSHRTGKGVSGSSSRTARDPVAARALRTQLPRTLPRSTHARPRTVAVAIPAELASSSRRPSDTTGSMRECVKAA